MKKIIDVLQEVMEGGFEQAGYDKKFGFVTVSNRPDLCQYQCNGAMAAAKQYKMAPFQIAEKVVEAVAESSLFNSDGYMWAPPQSITLTIDNKSYSIGYTKTNDIAAEILNDKTGFVYFTASSGKKTASHFVLVDGIDRTESDPLRKLLVVDPSYGDSRTLYDAMVANYEYCGLTNVTPSTSHLNSNFKCVFD